MTDNDYGPGFQKAREAALARSNGVCQACGHFKATAAHHWEKRYSPDTEITSDHLIGLCDFCHEMITTLRRALSAAESENHLEAGEDADRLTEKQKNHIRDLLRQRGFHFLDEGFVEDADRLTEKQKTYIRDLLRQKEFHFPTRGSLGLPRPFSPAMTPASNWNSIIRFCWARGGEKASVTFRTSPSAKPPRSLRCSKAETCRVPLPSRLLLPNRLRRRNRPPPRFLRARAPRVLGRGADGR